MVVYRWKGMDKGANKWFKLTSFWAWMSFKPPSEDKSIRDPFAENWQNVLGFSFPYPNGLCPKKKSRETTL
jgi:hypothetical protein